MDGLALKIGEQWARLGEDTSITITEKSVVFDDGNAFSIPFRLNAEMNRHLLGNAADIEGISFYEAIDRKPATLYVQGVPLFHGIVRLDDEEASLEDGCIDINLESGNLTLDDLIADMNCRDVPLKDKIILGEKLDVKKIYPLKWGHYINKPEELEGLSYFEAYYPDAYHRMSSDNEPTSNDFAPYPQAKYCNIRICCSMPEENTDGEDATSPKDYKKSVSSHLANNLYGVSQYGKYLVMDSDRKMSSPCFYVLYFLECLFKEIKVSYVDGISYMEDMTRLALVNMDFGFTLESTGDILFIDGSGGFGLNNKENQFCLGAWEQLNMNEFFYYSTSEIFKCIATSDNFPNKDVKDVINGLKSGFGIRFVPNREFSEIHTIFVKDILRDNSFQTINACIHDVSKVDTNIRGFRLTYGGDNDNTSYCYEDYSNYEIVDSFNKIVSHVSANNKKLYIDKRNGNAYRVKIDDDAVAMEYANPSLMEVGEFSDAEFGDCSDDNLIEEVEIGFSPIIMNDVSFQERKEIEQQKLSSQPIDNTITTGSSERTYNDNENNKQTFAFYLDVDMMYPSYPKAIPVFDFAVGLDGKSYKAGFVYTFYNSQRYNESYSTSYVNVNGENKIVRPTRYENKSPIHSYDCGLMLGIMRGPGNSAGVEDIEENYDEEGNFKYVLTGKTSAFHSDICDNYNRLFDYNGTEQGGVDVSGRFSLKLRAEKPNPEGGFFPITDVNMQKRGLFDKFYAEYAYFVTHRKTVKMKLRMEIADLIQIDWTKRYRIGNYTGFINKYEYTVTSQGIGEISMEMYVI